MMSGDLKVKGWRGKWGQQCADRQGKTCVCLCVCVKGSLRRLRGVYMESPSCLELRSFYFPSSLPFSCLSERELTRITVCEYSAALPTSERVLTFHVTCGSQSCKFNYLYNKGAKHFTLTLGQTRSLRSWLQKKWKSIRPFFSLISHFWEKVIDHFVILMSDLRCEGPFFDRQTEQQSWSVPDVLISQLWETRPHVNMDAWETDITYSIYINI